MASPTTQQADTKSTNGNTKPKKARKPRDPNAPVTAEEYFAKVRKNRTDEEAMLLRVPSKDRPLAHRMIAALTEPPKENPPI